MTTWQQWGTFGLAVIGAVLGVINTVHALGRDRVRVKVRARRWLDSLGHDGWVVEVVNRSTFEVTVNYISIPVGDQEFVHLDLLRELPKSLGARTAASFRLSPAALQNENCPRQGRFRVRTACGVVRHSQRVRFRE